MNPTLVTIPIVFIWILKLDQVPLCSDKKARNEMKLDGQNSLYTQWRVGGFKFGTEENVWCSVFEVFS